MLTQTTLEVLAQAPPPPPPGLVGGIPNPPAGVPAQFQDFGGKVVAGLKWTLQIGGLAGFLICGIMMVVGQRERSRMAQQGLFSSLWVLGGMGLGSVALALIGMFSL